MMSDQAGSAWNAKAQVDSVGINTMEKTLFLGEFKWTLFKNERKEMAEIVEEKAAKVILALGKWKVYFLGFSRTGLDIQRALTKKRLPSTRFEERTGRLRECGWSLWMNWMTIWFCGHNNPRRLQRRSQ
jgi:hypothetical protein